MSMKRFHARTESREDISDKCSHRSPQDCYEHYASFYLQGPLAPTLCGHTFQPSLVNDHISFSPLVGQEKPVLLEPVEQQLLGYMVLRDDFERDYDNDAESLLTRLNVRSDCDDLENALHVAHVNIYTQRLQERQKRKEIGRSHDLIYQLSAYLTYKVPRRRQQKLEPRPLLSPLAHRHKLTPISRTNRKKLTPQSSPASPPAGSWLAAPFALQSSGPTRGIPLVVPGVISLPQEQCCSSSDLEEYDAFNINEKLKPFLRYFTPTQAREFLRNLHREEVLKHEIKYLFNVHQKSGHRTSNSSRISSPLKAPSELRSQVYVPAPLNTEPIHPLLSGVPGFGSAAPLSPRRSVTAALRSSTAAAAAVAAATAHRSAQRRRQRRRHASSKPCQLLHDGYGVFALSLKKILVPNCETVASNKLLKLVKLGLAVSKYLEDSDLSKDFTHIVHAFQPGHPNNSSFFSNSSSSSNNQSIDQSPQQSLQQNGSQGAQFTLGVNQSLKLEPGDHAFNSLHLPLGAYQRQWVQMANRNTINLDGEIHELPGDGSPNKLFECSLCGKVFNRRDKVKRHLSELHHGIKRHQCVTCSRLFSRNDKLVRHIMTVHQGIKAFGCLHCPRRFSRRWEYQRHMQTTHPTLQGRLPLFTASPPQAKSANQQQSASQQVSPVTVVNTTPVSSSSSPTTPAQVSVASSPATATASTTAAVTSSSSRGMFPIFPVFTSPSATSWSSSTPSTANSAGATALAKSAVADSTTATVTATSVESSTPPSAAPPATSNAHGIFPMFPVFSQAQTSSSTSCSPAVAPFAASNNAVFPSPAPVFTPATTPYHSGYTTMTTPTTNAPTQSTCSESTSLTRMLL
ncbi:transcriptional adapter 2 beta [Echinococcus multilocularis]|uniref:Transcriptional adapter 2 beta n=1 Tax=Echinococcus multilocularis TaxID=6211 RepID=A0A087W200_ECHMU|nr:transcriptional adapter 2 beta [Echinococcus multilocularis]